MARRNGKASRGGRRVCDEGENVLSDGESVTDALD